MLLLHTSRRGTQIKQTRTLFRLETHLLMHLNMLCGIWDLLAMDLAPRPPPPLHTKTEAHRSRMDPTRALV